MTRCTSACVSSPQTDDLHHGWVSFQISSAPYPMLDTKRGERAMLIKNNKGDWGLVTGYWTGYKNAVKGGHDYICDSVPVRCLSVVEVLGFSRADLRRSVRVCPSHREVRAHAQLQYISMYELGHKRSSYRLGHTRS